MSIWRRSTKCAINACVEVAELSNGVYVRDSKELEGSSSMLKFEQAAWREFVVALKNNQL